MPCNSDHMEASTRERDLSRVACLLGELTGTKWTRAWWDGYHPTVYNQGLSKPEADHMVAVLCEALSACDVTRYSLEMQLWYRDHLEADRKREAAEAKARKRKQARERALAKLTDEEREALSLVGD